MELKMATTSEKFTLAWKNHANNFSASFKDLLDQKDFVDVQLVADGYLFSAHRLVLSALSPYFRNMFTQVPANQQAFVFMKDVSQQMVQHLLEFIYNGQVDVNQDEFEKFMDTGKALEIKGLTDDTYLQFFERSATASTTSGKQYQSSHTLWPQCPATDFQQRIDSEYEVVNAMDAHAHSHDDGENIYGLDVVEEDLSVDQELNTKNDQYFQNAQNEFETNGTLPEKCPLKAKRTKPYHRANDNEYTIVADIRTNEFGRENLYYNGQKFYKHDNGKFKSRWCCVKRVSNKCQSTVSTICVNGTMMLKIIEDNHTHEP